MDFFEKEEYTIEDIQLLISSGAEESLHLEFKEARALSKEEKSKIEMTKDVSAFANSDGGIIVYGIQEKDHKASHITYIDSRVYTKEWLELIINNGIDRRIPNLKIYPIHENGDLDKTVYVVKIPASIEVPHINKEKKFYKRFNFQAVAMEEYEVRQLYYRKNKAILDIEQCSLSCCDEQDKAEMIKLQLSVILTNIGDVCETDYKVQIKIRHGEKYISDAHKVSNMASFISLRDGIDVILSMNSSVFGTIFPKEYSLGFSVYLLIEKSLIQDFINNCTLDITVFYTNGFKVKNDISIKSILT